MTDSKRQIRVISADMSPQAIERRLKSVAELNELCAALGKALVKDDRQEDRLTP